MLPLLITLQIHTYMSCKSKCSHEVGGYAAVSVAYSHVMAAAPMISHEPT